MPLPFDATLKELGQDSPSEFLTAVDAPPAGPVALLNVDLSTVTTSADLIFGLGEPLAEIIHVDCQSGPDADLPSNVMALNALLHRRFRVPVHSIILLLRPRAQHPQVTGTLRYEPRPGRGKMDFGYEIVPLWKWLVEPILNGPLGLLPLAPLCQLPAEVTLEAGLAGVIQRLVNRLQTETTPERAKKLITAAFVLTGLRIDRDIAVQLFQGVRGMRESSTYQYILEEGRLEGEARGLQRALLSLGKESLGEPDAPTLTLLRSITDCDRLDRMVRRMPHSANWQELLQTP